MIPALAVSPAHPAAMVPWVPRDLRAGPVDRGLRAVPGHNEQRAHKEAAVWRGRPVSLVLQVLQALRAPPRNRSSSPQILS